MYRRYLTLWPLLPQLPRYGRSGVLIVLGKVPPLKVIAKNETVISIQDFYVAEQLFDWNFPNRMIVRYVRVFVVTEIYKQCVDGALLTNFTFLTW